MGGWRSTPGQLAAATSRRRWRCPSGDGVDINRNPDSYVLVGPVPFDLYHNSKYGDQNYWRVRCVTGGHALSQAFSIESSLSSNSFMNRRSLCLQAAEQTCNYVPKDSLPDRETQRSDRISIVDDENEELASNEFFESVSEEDMIQTAEANPNLSNTKISLQGAEGKNLTDLLLKTLMRSPCASVNDVLDKWIENGNMLGRSEVSVTMLRLRVKRHYGKALQFAKWLERRKCLNFVEHDYAWHLDLVARVHGLQQAEIYFKKIPASFRGEVTYRTFLANCVSALNVKKAEEVFNTMRDIGLPITTLACDQLLLLYKRMDREKVSDVLLLMEKESIKPSIFTYRLLIDMKGDSCDITGMEQIVEKMKAKGMWPDLVIQSAVVGFYIFGGLTKKAEAALKEMEGDIQENRDACKVLLPHYAALGKADDVGRIWKVCDANPYLEESLAAIDAWGKVGHVEKAEEVFEKTLKSSKKFLLKCYDALLRVYANQKLLSKGEDLVRHLKESGCSLGSSTCDALVKLYVGAGEVEKADNILLREAQRYKTRDLHASLVILLNEYSKRGDIHNSEKIFQKLRQTGFRNMMKLHLLLLEAYLNAKTPAYGFRERMKADYIFPNKQLAEKLAAVDTLLKSHVPRLEQLDVELSVIC